MAAMQNFVHYPAMEAWKCEPQTNSVYSKEDFSPYISQKGLCAFHLRVTTNHCPSYAQFIRF